MRSLRVLAVISSSRMGGAERYFSGLLSGLRSAGAWVHVACPPGPMAAEFGTHAAAVSEVPMVSPFSPRAARRLAGLVRETRPDVVHTHLWNADVLGAVAARSAGGPALLSTVYGEYYLDSLGEKGWSATRHKALSRTFRGVYRLFDRVLAVSNSVRLDLAGRSGLRVPSERVVVVDPPFASLASEPPGARPGDPEGMVILCLANFFRVKGQDVLLGALPALFQEFPLARCVFVGDGPERLRIAATAVRMGFADRVKFAGTVPDSKPFLRAASVLVLPSHSEGLPHSILEAWDSGVPIVATRVGGVPEAVRDGVEGVLVRPGDPTALAAAVARVLRDPELGRTLADAGRAVLRSRFGIEAAARRTLAAYSEARHSRATR